MEVHHHSHTERKKWTHYFWEFLMLFLAVFCGFLTENFREHQIEKDKAKQYIISLYEDLKNDTVRINELLIYDGEKIAGLSNIQTCYDTVLKDLRSTACMGILIKHSRSNRTFVMTDRTLRQLANAGGYCLLGKQDADSIIGYENDYKGYLDFQTTIFQQSQDNIRNTLNQMANFKVIAPLQLATAFLLADTANSKLSGPLLFTEDRVLVNKWFNELAMYLRVTSDRRSFLIGLRDEAARLIEYYKQKHHLQ